MTRHEYQQRILEATPGLGYSLMAPPAPKKAGNLDESKQKLLMLGRGTRAEFSVESAITRIVEESWPVALLREQIEKLGVRPQGRARVDLARQLITLFFDPGRLELVFRSLDAETQAFYAQLLLNSELSSWNADSEGMILLAPLSQPLTTFLRRIVDAGLAFEQEPDLLTIPPFLHRNLPHIYLPAEVFALSRPPQREQLTRPAHAVVQIQQFLGLLVARKITLRPVRRWLSPESWRRSYAVGLLPTPESARTLTKIRPHETLTVELLAPEPALAADDLQALGQTLGLPEAIVEGLYHLLVMLHVLRPGSPVQIEPALLEAFIALEPGEQLTALTRLLSQTSVWVPFWDLWRAGRVRVQWSHRSHYGTISHSQVMAQALTNLNNFFFRYLALLPHKLWLTPGVVVDLLAHFIPKGETLSPYRILNFADARGSWKGFLALYLEALLTGPLHWLGLCDVGYDAQGALTAFRLHHLQNVVWLREKALPLPQTIWSGDARERWIWKQGTLLLQLPVPTLVMQLLQQWAEPVGIEKDWLLYRPDVERLYAAFEHGETAATLRDRWLQSAGAAPPPELLQWWETWHRRYGHVRLYPHQAVLVATDELTLQEVQVALPELREGLLGLINSKTALLRSEEVSRLLQQLTARGYMPKELRAAAAGTPVLPVETEG